MRDSYGVRETATTEPPITRSYTMRTYLMLTATQSCTENEEQEQEINRQNTKIREDRIIIKRHSQNTLALYSGLSPLIYTGLLINYVP